jgi:tetratricopeptide (TPR) repeat protein
MEPSSALSLLALSVAESGEVQVHFFASLARTFGRLSHLSFGRQARIFFMSSPSPAPRARQRHKWPTRFIVLGLGLLLMLAVLAYVTVILGYVQGEEIASETFRRRTFEYYQLPLVEIQVSGITRTDSTGLLENYLIDEKLISVATASPTTDESTRWDLISADRFGTVYSRGEAEILCHYLDAVDADEQNLWVEWSKEHPKLAKVIWPAIVSVAQQELYIFVPELLELAGNATDPDELKAQLTDLLSRQYLRVATTQQKLARHELAVELFSYSLNHSPGGIDALQRRAESLTALGKTEKAEADLAQVRKLQRF